MLSVLLPLFGMAGKAYEAKQARKATVEEAKGRQAVKRLDNGHTWELTVANLSTRFMRWFFAVHIFLALDFTIYLAVVSDPNPAIIFQAFAYIPEWFVGLIATMFGFAFGSEPAKNIGAKLMQGLANISRKA